MVVFASVTESLVTTTWHFVRDGGIPAIFVMMALDSACIPIPSEAVLLFAGFAVADPGGSGAHHHLSMAAVVIAGLLGTLAGSWAAYAVARAGRLELLERYGRRIHMGPAQIATADRWFARYGNATVLFGRMVPVLRTFVSLPAGVARMPVGRFTTLTVVGSVPWVLALAMAGHALGAHWTVVRQGFEYVDFVVLALVALAIAGAIVRRLRRSAAAKSPTRAGGAEQEQSELSGLPTDRS